jgi:carbon starvation protein
VTGFFIVMIAAIVIFSVREWIFLLSRRRAPQLSETTATFLPDYAVAEGRPRGLAGLALFGFLMLREWTGHAAIDRAATEVCACEQHETKDGRARAYLKATEKRFDGVNGCC